METQLRIHSKAELSFSNDSFPSCDSSTHLSATNNGFYEALLKKKKGSKGGTDVDNEAAELELFGCDDVMVTRLLGQLHDSATRSEPQTRHVRLAVETKKRCRRVSGNAGGKNK